jgi:tyrosine-protein phosphatase SIW14
LLFSAPVATIVLPIKDDSRLFAEGADMTDRRRVAFLFLLIFALAAWATFDFRAEYTHGKRLRTVREGKFYRSGQLTEAGFREAVRDLGIRTIINVQDELPDPKVWLGHLDRRTIPESALCDQLGVRYVWLAPDVLPPHEVEDHHPVVIDQFLEVLDDPAAYPVLLHCKAGLHRTGVLTAVYRMEYEGWSRRAAFRELRAHGFGDWVSTTANPYVDQYVFRYRPRASAAPRQASADAARRPGLRHPRVD